MNHGMFEFMRAATNPVNRADKARFQEMIQWPCEHCKKAVNPLEAFCRFCGRKNTYFSNEHFELLWGASLTEVQNLECQNRHPRLSSSKFFVPRTSWCYLCGQEISLSVAAHT